MTRRVLLNLWRTVRLTVDLYARYDTGARAAAIAFYALLSVFPLLLFLVGILGRWLSTAEAEALIRGALGRMAPVVPEALWANLERALALRGPINVVAALTLAWSASSLFAAVIHALDRVWNERGGRAFWEHRLLSVALVVVVTLLFVFSLILGTVMAFLPRLIVFLLPIRPEVVERGWQFVPTLITFGLDVSLYALLYRFLPARYPPWPAVWAGAVVAAVGEHLVRIGFGLYLTYFARYGLVYGTLATLVAFLLWVYLSGLVLLIGAEFGVAWERIWLSSPRPSTIEAQGF